MDYKRRIIRKKNVYNCSSGQRGLHFFTAKSVAQNENCKMSGSISKTEESKKYIDLNNIISDLFSNRKKIILNFSERDYF